MPAKNVKRARKRKRPGGRPPKAPERRLETQLALRADAETVGRLECLVETYSGVVNRAVVARVALKLGLGVLEGDPNRLFAPPSESKKGSAMGLVKAGRRRQP